MAKIMQVFNLLSFFCTSMQSKPAVAVAGDKVAVAGGKVAVGDFTDTASDASAAVASLSEVGTDKTAF